jgi:hypothetical protein
VSESSSGVVEVTFFVAVSIADMEGTPLLRTYAIVPDLLKTMLPGILPTIVSVVLRINDDVSRYSMRDVPSRSLFPISTLVPVGAQAIAVKSESLESEIVVITVLSVVSIIEIELSPALRVYACGLMGLRQIEVGFELDVGSRIVEATESEIVSMTLTEPLLFTE